MKLGLGFLLTLLLFGLAACDRATVNVTQLNGYAQGTTYSIGYWSTENIDAAALQVAINQELARIDLLISNYRDDSTIERFNSSATTTTIIPLDHEILKLLAIAKQIYLASNGCYDPTARPLFKLWGFSDKNFIIPDQQQIQTTLQSVGFDKLQQLDNGVIKTTPQLHVDLSSIGQGYAVAQVAAVLEARGIVNYLVEIGGEMLVAGQKPDNVPWRVGVEQPLPDSQAVSEIITLSGTQPTAIMTSGTYRHFFSQDGNRYSHIINPKTGRPVTHHSLSVTVLLEDATKADAWSTALLCLGSEQGVIVADQHNIAAIFYDTNGKTVKRRVSKAIKQGSKHWQLTKNTDKLQQYSGVK